MRDNDLNTEKSDLEFTKEVHFERIKILYQAGFNGLLGGFLVIFFFPFFMWPRMDHTVLLVWTFLILAVNIPRIFLLNRFKYRLARNEITKDNAYVWERYFVAGFMLSGLVWAAVIFFPYQEDRLASLLFVLAVQVGINAAIAAMYLASENTVMTYLTITMVPTLMRIAWDGQWPHTVVGLLGIAFYFIMIRNVQLHGKNLMETIELKLRNEVLSKKDALTGLWNRRQLYEFTEKLIPASIRHNLPFCVMLIDIDYFKKYNDTKGHSAGDVVLSKVSKIISSNIRSEDLAVRYGGEEFMVVFAGIGISKAAKIGERLRIAVKGNTEVTISAGLAEFDKKSDFDTLTRTADNLLYQAKENGRDRMAVEMS